MNWNQGETLTRLYASRFDSSQRKAKLLLWKVLVQDFLQKYIKKTATVLDIAGGYCEFINQVKAKEKYLIDLNPDAKLFADPDVHLIVDDIVKPQHSDTLNRYFDVIFTSNFFEHLRSKEELIQVLLFCFNQLKPGGSLLIIQPNFKYSYKEYYDFIDHHLPITHLALDEVLRAVGFEVKTLIPRFLPFTTKGRPSAPWMLRLYLKLPVIWRFFGAQMFVVAVKPPA
jgi:SAM-dependent methyltransferase